jgi:hypothetical protein
VVFLKSGERSRSAGPDGPHQLLGSLSLLVEVEADGASGAAARSAMEHPFPGTRSALGLKRDHDHQQRVLMVAGAALSADMEASTKPAAA